MEPASLPTTWQPELGTFGTMVEGLDDLYQCLLILLTTPKGSDPHRPTFGLDLLRFQDRPVDAVRPQLTQEVLEAVRRWERRIKVTAIRVDADALGGLRLSLGWIPSGEANAETQAVTRVTFQPQADTASVLPLASLPWVPFTAEPLAITGIDGDAP